VDEERFGYLIAKVEEISEDFRELKGRFDTLEKRVEEKFTTVETALRIVKYVGLVLLALLTFKFGDIPGLWVKLLG
jgi:tetrahydromethanopterin S-methyltransferase subunit G